MLHYILKRIFNRSYKREMNVSSIWPLFYWVPVNVICNRYFAFCHFYGNIQLSVPLHTCWGAGCSFLLLPQETVVLQGSSVVQREDPDRRLLILLLRPSCYKHDCPTSYLYVEDNWGWTWRAFVSFQEGSRGNVYHKLGRGQLPHRHRRLAWHSLQSFSLPLCSGQSCHLIQFTLKSKYTHRDLTIVKTAIKGRSEGRWSLLRINSRAGLPSISCWY